MAATLAVNEIYGPVTQGEGPSLGRPCAFLRAAACNQHCVWCDTPYTWDWKRYDPKKEVHKMSVDEVVSKVLKVLPPGDSPMLVISGGEPFLQQETLADVIHELNGWVTVEVETAGSIKPHYEPFLRAVDAFNVSLKLAHSGNEKSIRYNPFAIDELQASGKARWKFVAVEPSDFDEIDEIVEKHMLEPIYIMPEGVTAAAVSAHAVAISPEVIKRGWYLTPRLHVMMYGAERGR